jgi:tetratricopeptide (TPR) repeat protein
MFSRKQWALLLVALLAVCCWNGQAKADDPVAQMDALYAQRGGTDAIPKQILELAEKAFAATPKYDIAWRAARAAFWICDRTESKEVKKMYGKQAWDWGQKAIELNPNGVEGHFFACCGVGEYSKGVGIGKAVKDGLAKKFETYGNRAIALNPAYDDAGPLRAMGLYYQKLPFFLRNADKAEDYFRRAIAAAPCMIRTYYYLADLYREDKKWDKARAAADAGLAQSGCPENAWECAYFKEQLTKLQAALPAK